MVGQRTVPVTGPLAADAVPSVVASAQTMTDTYRFDAELWEYPGPTAWVFLTVPPGQSADIAAIPRAPRPGFGSIRVSVTLGGSTWLTSIFPDSKSGTFLLPVKKAIRAREKVEPGDVVDVGLELLE